MLNGALSEKNTYLVQILKGRRKLKIKFKFAFFFCIAEAKIGSYTVVQGD
jgi:hypothetical protein